MEKLNDILLCDEKKEILVEDCQAMLESEVQKKRGLSGAAIKTGFKMVKTFKKGFLPKVVRELLPDFCEALDPLHERWGAAQNGSFGDHMKASQAEVTTVLLAVSDRRVEQLEAKSLRKLYSQLRGSAEKHVNEAVPALAELMDKHYPARGSLSS